MKGNMVSETYVYGEVRALALLHGEYSHYSPHAAGNEIIALAEQIKAERAVVAMQHQRRMVVSDKAQG